VISLFNINQYSIDTSALGNFLHGGIVSEFEQRFAEYVGAKYACSANSASSLIYLATKSCDGLISIPSCIPPVVPNALEMAGARYMFHDDIEWVGKAYSLFEDDNRTIIDSAQEVTKNQFKDLGKPNAEMIFSFYPTKPVGGCDGGMVVSDNKETIDLYKALTLNGMSYSENNWERKQIFSGHKMHFNSISAYIANENLSRLDEKNDRLDEISDMYNKAFYTTNSSRHLYRIRVHNNKDFISKMKDEGILCGIHYEHCHDKSFYNPEIKYDLQKSARESITTVSLPYHENMTKQQVNKVIKNVKKMARI
jgi:perosamine synthetase|tara:strand:+ start:329 stop:1255 length:927 start_codon:yes stop_codon:yes gene_type:complete